MNKNAETPRPSGVSRRAVVKGAAWAVPAITVASAVPAVAQSGIIFDASLIGDGCKFSGNQTVYHLEIVITNTGNVAATIENVLVTGANSSGETLVFPSVPDKCMCPGDEWVLVINSAVTSSAASFDSAISWQGSGGSIPLTSASTTTNAPDCSSVKELLFEDRDNPSYVSWEPLNVSPCLECP